MMRSAVSLPPSCDDTALVTIVSGIMAVSAPEARAIERSNPATFWNRLTTRSTNSGRSQNVSVRTTRSRSTPPPPLELVGLVARHGSGPQCLDQVDAEHE